MQHTPSTHIDIGQFDWLVKECVHRMRKPGRDESLLLSAAWDGLHRASRAFLEQKNVPFQSYARHRMMGQMRDSLRTEDYLSRLDRSLKVKVDHHMASTSVGHEEAYKALGLSKPDIARCRTMPIHHQMSDPAKCEALWPSISAVDVPGEIDRAAVRKLLQTTLEAYRPAYRAVVIGIFFDERTQSQIANELGLTEGRISQMLRRFLDKCKEDRVFDAFSFGNTRKAYGAHA